MGNGGCGLSMTTPSYHSSFSHFSPTLAEFFPWGAVLQDKSAPPWGPLQVVVWTSALPCRSRLPTRCHHLGCEPQPCPVGPLEPSGASMEQLQHCLTQQPHSQRSLPAPGHLVQGSFPGHTCDQINVLNLYS